MPSKKPRAPTPVASRWEPVRDVLESLEQVAAAGWYPARRELLSRLEAGPQPGRLGLPTWVPEADVDATSSEIAVSFALPGVEKDDIRLSATEWTVTVHGRRHEEKDGRVHARRERPRGEFLRRVRLPEEVKPASARAVYRNGVLRVTLSRAHVSAGRSVKIE